MPDKSERVLVKMLLHITWHFLFSRFQSVAMMRKAPIGHCRTRIIPRASVIRCDAATMTYGIHTAGFPQLSHHGFGPNGITRGLERQPWTMYKIPSCKQYVCISVIITPNTDTVANTRPRHQIIIHSKYLQVIQYYHQAFRELLLVTNEWFSSKGCSAYDR